MLWACALTFRYFVRTHRFFLCVNTPGFVRSPRTQVCAQSTTKKILFHFRRIFFLVRFNTVFVRSSFFLFIKTLISPKSWDVNEGNNVHKSICNPSYYEINLSIFGPMLGLYASVYGTLKWFSEWGWIKEKILNFFITSRIFFFNLIKT